MDALKKIGSGISAFLPHLVMTYSVMLLTFFGINCVNTAMQFLDSRISQRFHLFYAMLAVLTALLAIFGKRLRIPAVCVILVVVAFVIPDIRALMADKAALLDSSYFRVMALVSSLTTLVFCIADICVMRKRARLTAAESA